MIHPQFKRLVNIIARGCTLVMCPVRSSLSREYAHGETPFRDT